MLKNHLIVVCHGLLADSSHVRQLASALRTAHPSALVHMSTSNSLYLSPNATLRGVLAGGDALAAEVRRVAASCASLTHLSLIGFSLGGVFCRAAAASLLLGEARLPLEPASYISIATPHTGVRGHLLGVAERAMAAGALGLTGYEMLLRDRGGEGGGPLLSWMANPASPYHAALQRFAHRVLLANTHGDDKVPYHSASLLAAPRTPVRACEGGAAPARPAHALRGIYEMGAPPSAAASSVVVSTLTVVDASGVSKRHSHSAMVGASTSVGSDDAGAAATPSCCGSSGSGSASGGSGSASGGSGSARGSDSGSGDSGSTRGSSGGGAAEWRVRFPHISGVYVQAAAGVACSTTGVAACCPVCGAEAHASECLARGLRSGLTWTNVDVTFLERWCGVLPSVLVNHLRIVCALPFMSLGEDVITFLATQCLTGKPPETERPPAGG